MSDDGSISLGVAIWYDSPSPRLAVQGGIRLRQCFRVTSDYVVSCLIRIQCFHFKHGLRGLRFCAAAASRRSEHISAERATKMRGTDTAVRAGQQPAGKLTYFVQIDKSDSNKSLPERAEYVCDNVYIYELAGTVLMWRMIACE